MFPAYAAVIRALASTYYGDFPLDRRPAPSDMSAGFLADVRSYFAHGSFDRFERWFRANDFEYQAQVFERNRPRRIRRDSNEVLMISQILLHESAGAPAVSLPWSLMQALSATHIDSALPVAALLSPSIPDTLWAEFSGDVPRMSAMPWLRKCLGLLVSRITIFDDPSRIAGFRAENRAWADDMGEMLVTLTDAASQGVRCIAYRMILAVRQNAGIRFVPVTVGEDASETVRTMLASAYFVTDRDARSTRDMEQVFSNFGIRLLLLAIFRKWFSHGPKEIELRASTLSDTDIPPGMFSFSQNHIRLTHPPGLSPTPFRIERTD